MGGEAKLARLHVTTCEGRQRGVDKCLGTAWARTNEAPSNCLQGYVTCQPQSCSLERRNECSLKVESRMERW